MRKIDVYLVIMPFYQRLVTTITAPDHLAFKRADLVARNVSTNCKKGLVLLRENCRDGSVNVIEYRAGVPGEGVSEDELVSA
jgi:hypothetical protein